MEKFKVCLCENRLIFQNASNAPEAPKQQVAEDSVAKIAREGFENPDGSYYDPEKSLYVSGKDDNGGDFGISLSPHDAIQYKKEGALPFVKLKVEVKAAKAAGHVETKQETGAQLVEVKTQMDLEVLKNKMAKDFEDLEAAVSLEGKSIEGNPSAVSFSISTITLDEKALSKEVLKLLDPGKLKVLSDKLEQATGLKIKAEDADDLLAVIYANSIVAETKRVFNKRYSRYNEFITHLPKPMDMSRSTPFEVKFGKGVGFAVVLKVENTEFDNAYNGYLSANPTAKEAPKSSTAQEENLKARAKVLQDSFAGKALSWLGLVKLEKVPEGASEQNKSAIAKRNQDAYAAALSGENTFAKWVVWLLGGGAMLDGGGEDIAASLKDMDPKHAAIVAGLQKQARALPFSLEKAAQKAKPLEGGVAGEEFEAVDKGNFDEIVKDNKKMPEKGLKLKEAFEFGAQKLILNLKGAEIILPKGTSVRRADGNLETASDADKSFKDTELVLIEQLPAGTVFRGKPVLKLEKIGP